MPIQEVQVISIGKVARDALAQVLSASVLGKTSRGLFLLLPSGWVIFLSLEPHRGPLTLNLRTDPGIRLSPALGSVAHCSPEEIRLPGIHISLPASTAGSWQAPALPEAPSPPVLIQERLRSVARLATHSSATGQLIDLLPLLLGSQDLANFSNNMFALRLARLQAVHRTGNIAEISAALQAFLGLGLGLTPSGDDLVAGFLLAANRWGEALFPQRNLAGLSQEILGHARQATSSLSASLIECALLGQADERLILALDGIVTGEPDLRACVAALASWGSSSGFDALVGMAVFLLL